MTRLAQIAVCLLSLGTISPASAAEFVPIVKLDALGGQFFFKGKNTSFSGNGDWLISPGVRLSERDLLIPTIAGQYKRTREVRELLGGGFLTTEQLDNSGSLKWVHLLGEKWAVKPNVSFKKQEVAESAGESLSGGLFDFNKFAGGLEVERRGERFKSIRQSFNAYGVRFYNYKSLASQQQAQLGVEINAGSRVLDFDAYDYTIASDYMLDEKTLISGASLVSYRPFLDQKTVQQSGTFTHYNRRDLFLYWALSPQHKLPDLMNGERSIAQIIGLVNLSYARLFSNQNNFDAAKTRFTPAYYNYGEFSVAPGFALKFANKLSATISYEYARRDYSWRQLRDVQGNYVPGLVMTETHTLSYELSYPLTKHFTLKAQGAYRAAGSNMKFEQSYIYNYMTSHYFVGVGYAL